MREMANRYRYVGYGTGFHRWLYLNGDEPFGSYGNGSAMRVSYIAEYYHDLVVAQRKAEQSAACTHNHPEGIKGAVVAVTCMWMAHHGCSKNDIAEYAVHQYPASIYEFGCDRPIMDYREDYRFDATCQGSVPVAIRCFLESNHYESCLRNAFQLHCDLDTVCCVAGGIAESFYGSTGLLDQELLRYYLDEELYDLVRQGRRSEIISG